MRRGSRVLQTLILLLEWNILSSMILTSKSWFFHIKLCLLFYYYCVIVYFDRGVSFSQHLHIVSTVRLVVGFYYLFWNKSLLFIFNKISGRERIFTLHVTILITTIYKTIVMFPNHYSVSGMLSTNWSSCRREYYTWIKSLHAYGSFMVEILSPFLQDEQIPVFSLWL